MKQVIRQANTAGTRGPGAAIGGSKPRNAGYALCRIWQGFQGSRAAFVVASAFAIGSVFASTIGPWQLGKATDILVAAITQGSLDRGAFIGQLALVVAILISMGLTKNIAGAARPNFADQWRETGNLNATVEESFSAQALIRASGARDRIRGALCHAEPGLGQGQPCRTDPQLDDPARHHVREQPCLYIRRYRRGISCAGRTSLSGRVTIVHAGLNRFDP